MKLIVNYENHVLKNLVLKVLTIAISICANAQTEKTPIKGDINDDGVVNVADIVEIVNIIMNESEYEDTSCDVGSVKYNDTIIIDTPYKKIKVIENTAAKQIADLYNFFRIPSAVITNAGTILVAYENRKELWDKGIIDILLSRESKDGYLIKKLFFNSNTTSRSMNPIFLIDREGCQGKPGRIYLFTCYLDMQSYATQNTHETSDFVYKYSDDDGVTWSPEYSLKKYWDTEKYSIVIPSAANGIVDDYGTFIIPTMVVKDGKWRSGLAFKKVNCDWCFSTPTPCDGDSESTVYIDKDGRIILDCRVDDANIRRKYIYDMYGDFYTKIPDEPSVPLPLKAEIHKCIINGQEVYLLSYVDSQNNLRENITLYASTDAMKWNKVARLQNGDLQVSAYSNVYSYSNKTIFTYENNYEIKIMDISALNDVIIQTSMK